MLTSIRGLAAASFLTASLLAAAPAYADDEEDSSGPITVSGSATITTDYRFRGVSLSGGDPAIQGGFDITHDSGFYIGTWGSSIDDGGTDVYGDMEWDIYAGFGTDVAEGVSIDVGLLYYAYPTNNDAFDPVNYWEPYASVTGTIGPVEATAGINYAWKQDSLGGEDNLYLHGELSAGIPQTPITLSGHLGYTDGVQAPDYLVGLSADRTAFDWSIGASATVLGHLDIGVSYIGVEAPAIKAAGLDNGVTNDTVVATLGVSF